MIGRAANRSLSTFGLQLGYLQYDFDDKPLDEETQNELVRRLAKSYDEWVAGQEIFLPVITYDTTSAVRLFFESWLETPFREQQGGSRFNNLLWLHLIAKSMNPDLIIDSGTFRGASAWALSSGSATARVFSFDVSLVHLALKVPGVHYIEADWSTVSLAAHAGNRILAYFDDHVDQIRRLIESQERSCNVVIFDDDFPVTSYFAMAPSPRVLPKIEFALDDRLRDGQLLRWRGGGAEHCYRIDRSYLERGRSCIAATERLPNTSLITGVHQTPYRIVGVRRIAGH